MPDESPANARISELNRSVFLFGTAVAASLLLLVSIHAPAWRGHHSGFTQVASVSASAPLPLVGMSSTSAIDAPDFIMVSSSVSPRPDIEGVVETLLTRQVALSRLGSLHGP